MLHILWMIIKFILILIGIILGLILFALLLILFCPVRYRAEGTKEAGSFRTASGRAKVSWLFGGISFSLGFQNGQTVSDFRLFGIPVMKVLKKLRNRKNKKKTDPDMDDEIEYSETDEDSTGNATYIEAKELSRDETKHSREVAETPQASWPEMETSEEDLSDPDIEKERKWQQTAEKLKNLFYDLENLSRKKDALCDKIDWWKAFIGHPRTQKAISLVKTRAFRLLRHVFPTKVEGELVFDCTDPSITGSVLAVLGMTIPLHRNCIRVMPLFENRNVLYGNVNLKVRVYGIMLVKTAIELYFDKNIKYVIRRWKHK